MNIRPVMRSPMRNPRPHPRLLPAAEATQRDHGRIEFPIGWVKAWGTLAFNPVSALTGMTMAEICRSPDTRALVVRMMTVSREIATRLGVTMRVPLEKRLLGAERVGHHKTSMLQDLEAGRPLEIEANLGTIVELGELVGAHADTLRSVLELARAIDPGRRTGAAARAAVEAAAAS